MKTKKQPKETKYIVRITDGTTGGPKSIHEFKDEYHAKEFYDKIKFALEIIQDDWYYVCLVEEKK